MQVIGIKIMVFLTVEIKKNPIFVCLSVIYIKFYNRLKIDNLT